MPRMNQSRTPLRVLLPQNERKPGGAGAPPAPPGESSVGAGSSHRRRSQRWLRGFKTGYPIHNIVQAFVKQRHRCIVEKTMLFIHHFLRTKSNGSKNILSEIDRMIDRIRQLR